MINGRLLALWTMGIGAFFQSQPSMAGPNEECAQMFRRLTGLPPSASDLQPCIAKLSAGDAAGAARDITQNPYFYQDTLRYVFSRWTNEDDNAMVPLNDMIATALGLVRDDADFRTFLYDDVQYTCENVQGVPNITPNNNNHYAACENETNYSEALVRKTQSEFNQDFQGRDDVPAGVFTTRGFAEGFYIDGTNRVATRYTLNNFLCEDIESFHDTSIPDFRVRQDVDRRPGGVAVTYVNECKGCHAGMDGLTGAFAYLNWNADDSVIEYSKPANGTPEEFAQAVQAKYFVNNNTFPSGFVTSSDQWINLWTEGQNARVGWPGTTEGAGPKSFGMMFSETEQFSTCMAKHAVKKVCYQDKPLNDEDILKIAEEFKASGYSLREAFVQAALTCKGSE